MHSSCTIKVLNILLIFFLQNLLVVTILEGLCVCNMCFHSSVVPVLYLFYINSVVFLVIGASMRTHQEVESSSV